MVPCFQSDEARGQHLQLFRWFPHTTVPVARVQYALHEKQPPLRRCVLLVLQVSGRIWIPIAVVLAYALPQIPFR